MRSRRRASGVRGVAAVLFVLAVAGGCDGAPESSPPDADLVLPGTFSEQTTVDDLKVRFGDGTARVGTLDDGEPAPRSFPTTRPAAPASRAVCARTLRD